MENINEEVDERLYVDFEEEVVFIVNETGLDKEIVEKVLNSDFNFLVEKGIIVETEGED